MRSKDAGFGAAVAGAVLLAGAAWAAGGQASVSTAEIQRLEQLVVQAATDVAQLRGRDAALADSLQRELDELREELIYLKVKLRKGQTVSRQEYGEVRDRLEALRTRATMPSAPAAERASAGAGRRAAGGALTVPVGTELDVRLQTTLSSGTAKVEDRFEATTVADLRSDGRVLIPAGSLVRGVVSGVEEATRTRRKGRLSLSFDQITIRGTAYPIRATVTQALESEGLRGEAGRIGAGAAAGAIIGGILGGVRGALAGILIGGGGVVAATEGEEVTLPAGTILRLRLDTPLTP